MKGDSGTINSNWLSVPGRNVMRDGQKAMIYNPAVTTLTGKRGTLTIRDRNEWVDLGQRLQPRRRERLHRLRHLDGRARDRPVRRRLGRAGAAMWASDARGTHATRAS